MSKTEEDKEDKVEVEEPVREEKPVSDDGGTAKNQTENADKGPQGVGSETPNDAEATNRKRKNGGARRVEEKLRAEVQKGVQAFKDEVKKDVSDARQEIEDVRTGKVIKDELDAARQQIKDVETGEVVRNELDAANQEIDDLKKGNGQSGTATPQGGVQEGQAPTDGSQEGSDTETADVSTDAGQTGTDVAQGDGTSTTTDAGPATTQGTSTPQDPAAPVAPASAPGPASVPPVADAAAGANANFGNVSGDMQANAAGASSEVTQTDKSGMSRTEENKTLTPEAKAEYDALEEAKQKQAAQSAQAQKDYGIEPKEDIEKSIYEDKIRQVPDYDNLSEREKNSVNRKAARQAKREAEREYETRLDDIYRKLVPGYKSEREYKREQNIKAIIAGIGDLGRMAGHYVTAKNAGTILPFRSLTQGAINDIRISDRERANLINVYEKMRQGKLAEAQQNMKDYEKMQLDLLKSPAAYNSNKTTVSSDSEAKRKDAANTEFKPAKDANGNNVGTALSGKLGNNQYALPAPYKNGYPTGEYAISISSAVPAVGRLFEAYKEMPGATDVSGIADVWKTLHEVKQGVKGGIDERTKQAYQNYISGILDKMLNEMEKSDSDVAKNALKAYDEFLRGTNGPYVIYGGGGQAENKPATLEDILGGGGEDDNQFNI